MSQYFCHKVTFIVWLVTTLANLAWSTISMFVVCTVSTHTHTHTHTHTGVAHSGVTCDGCFQTPVSGIRWKCAICNDFDLCSECYMTDKHPTEHRFLRYNTPDSER